MRRTVLLTVPLLLATAGFAHEGVKNPAVMARMKLMGDIKEATGVLGGMARGKVAFDAAQAEQARAALQSAAARIAPLFEDEETDPKSESLPQIWSDWDRFAEQAVALERAAAGMETGGLDAVRAGMGAVGQSCQSCHEGYRLKK